MVETKSVEKQNDRTIFEGYGIVLESYKKQLSEMTKIIEEVQKEATRERRNSKRRIDILERDNRELRNIVEVLTQDICVVKGVSREELFKDLPKVPPIISEDIDNEGGIANE